MSQEILKMSDSESSSEEQLSPPRPRRENCLTKPLSISFALKDFLGLQPGEKISRSKVNTAITMYINIRDVSKVPAEKQKWIEKMNPGGQRNLTFPSDVSIIIPDEKLSKLLDYPAYVESVAKGEKKWQRKNITTGQMEEVVETDPKLTYSVVQHLLGKHFNNEQDFMVGGIKYLQGKEEFDSLMNT